METRAKIRAGGPGEAPGIGRFVGRINKRQAQAKRGFTLVEVCFSMVVLMVGVLAITSTTLRIDALRRRNHEAANAQLALRRVAETLHSHAAIARSQSDGDTSNTFSEVFLSLAEADFGDGFDVPGFTPLPGEETVGTLELVTSEVRTDAQLDVLMGMPRDLNGDGDVFDLDVSEDARLIPAVVRLSWRGPNGDMASAHPVWVQGD